MAVLLAPFLPDPGEPLLRALSTYLDLLLRWNARLNLTAVRDPEQIVTRHFGESLFAAQNLYSSAGDWRLATGDSFFGNCQRSTVNCLLDLGSGAGFPGVPIKLYAPALQLTLVESKYRKATFLRELLRALTLPGAQVFSGRAEDFPPPPAGAAVTLTLRAVERFDQILPIAARLLIPTSALNECHPERGSSSYRRLALLIGATQIARAQSLLPGFSWNAPIPIPQSSSRVLLVGNL